MQSIKVRQHVGADGILHLDIPIGILESEVEAMVTYKSVQTSQKTERSLADFYGICADDPIVVDDKFAINHGGVCSALDDDMEGAFD
ncbi:hypothetical protein [Altericista sp. CCNU0014]|uniref:hypothetical protein n=1 Tax=Altericista sp. CCNU0014 TaxID=3082949 RepID=UPI00384F9276